MLCIGGRKSRNKVIVGEPAIGSLMIQTTNSGLLAILFYNHIILFEIVMGDASAYLAMKGDTLLDNWSEL